MTLHELIHDAFLYSQETKYENSSGSACNPCAASLSIRQDGIVIEEPSMILSVCFNQQGNLRRLGNAPGGAPGGSL